MTEEPDVSPSEFLILRCLFEREESDIHQLMDDLQHREDDNALHWTRTTVLTLLKRLENKGYVGRRREKNSNYYKPMKSLHQVMDVILKQYFGTKANSLLQSYLQNQPDYHLKVIKNPSPQNQKPTIPPCEFWILHYLYENQGAYLFQILQYLHHHEKKNATQWIQPTVSSMLLRLQKKGYVHCLKESFDHYYQPVLPLKDALQVIFHQNLGFDFNILLIHYLLQKHQKDQPEQEENALPMICSGEFLIFKCLHQKGVADTHQILSFLEYQEKKTLHLSTFATTRSRLKNLINKGYAVGTRQENKVFYQPTRTLQQGMETIFNQYFGSKTHSILMEFLLQQRPLLTPQEEESLKELLQVQSLKNF